MTEVIRGVFLTHTLLIWRLFQQDSSGLGKCPMTWEYWTSPKIVAI